MGQKRARYMRPRCIGTVRARTKMLINQCLCQALSGISNICSDLYANCSPVQADLVLNPVLRGDNLASNSHIRCTSLFNWLPYTRSADAFGGTCFRCQHVSHILCAVCVLSVILDLLISSKITFIPSSLPASFF